MKSIDVMIKVIIFLVLLIGLLALMFTLAEHGWGAGDVGSPAYIDHDMNPTQPPTPSRTLEGQ